MNRISMWDRPLIGLLTIMRDKLENGDVEGAKESITNLIIQIEGWGEE